MLKKFFKRAAIAIVALLLIVGVALYFSRGAIAETISKSIDEQLTKEGIHLAYTPTDFSLFSGLSFTDITLYESAERTKPVIELSNLAVGYKLMDLIFSPEKRSAVVAMDDATLTAYHEGEPYRFNQIDASINLSQSQLLVDRLTGDVFGLNVDLAGAVELETAPTAAEDQETSSEPSQGEEKSDLELDMSPIAELAEAMKLEATGDAPTLKVRFAVDTEQVVTGSAELNGKDFSWDGVPIDQLAASVELENGPNAPIVMLKSLELIYGGKPLLAEGSYDLESETLTLTKLDSKVDLMNIASQFSESTDPEMLRFLEPPHLVVSGTVPISNLDGAILTGSASCPGGIEVAFDENQKLVVSEIATTFELSEGFLKFPDLASKVLGGSAKMDMGIKPFAETPYLKGTFALEDLSLAEISNFAGQDGDGKVGRVSASFEGEGEPDLKKLNGSGSIAMRDANFVSIPIYRKLQPIFAAINAGTFNANKKGTTLDATYQLGEGKLTTNDVVLKEGVFVVTGTANVNFETEELLATASAKSTSGLARVFQEFEGQSLDIEASGTFDNYKWRPTNIPGLGSAVAISDLSREKLGNLLQGVGLNEDSVSKTAEDITNMARDAAENLPFLRGLNKKLNPAGSETSEEEPPKARRPGE